MPIPLPNPHGTMFQAPRPNQLLFSRNMTRPMRILGEFVQGGKQQIHARDYSGSQSKSVDRIFAKSELGVSIDLHPYNTPRRLIGGKAIPRRPVDLVLPRFTEGPCVTAANNCLVITFKTSELTRAEVYYGIAATSGPYPSYACGYGYGGNPTMGQPTPPMYGGGYGNYRPGYSQYPYSYGYGGYDDVSVVNYLNTQHEITICDNILSNTYYNVMVCIWDQKNNGPACSQNITVFHS